MMNSARHLVIVAFLLTVTNSCSIADTAASQKRPAAAAAEQQRAMQVASLVTRAESAEAEVAADLLLRIAESDLISEKQEKIGLIEEAFRRASDAQQKVKRKIWAGAVDTRPGYLASAYQLDLDALSLQGRAVRAMLALDKQAARKLLADIPKIKLAPLSCADALSYDVSDFYETLKQVAQTTFSPAEKSQGEQARFVALYLDEINSPAQLGPMIDVIRALDIPPNQLPSIIHGLNGALKNVSDDPRSFALSVKYGRVMQGVEGLAEECRRKNVAPTEMLKTFRAYFVNHLSSTQCSDAIISTGQVITEADDVGYVNKWLDVPISPEEVRPARIEGPPEVRPFWTSPDAKALLVKVKTLKFGKGNRPLTAEEKDTLEWQERLGETLNDIEHWGGVGERLKEDYFHQKCSLYRALLEMTPEGNTRKQVLVSFVRFLRETNVRQESRIEWMLHANYLLGGARAGRKSGSGLLEALSDSGDFTLQVYSDFQKLIS